MAQTLNSAHYLRVDPGFREAPMPWCKANGMDSIFRLVTTPRLTGVIGAELAEGRT